MNTVKSVPLGTQTHRLIIAVFFSVLVVGCATSPVGVKRLSPEKVHHALTANALTENTPSVDSTNVLHREGLFELFKKQPAQALWALNTIAVTTNDNDTWFALAELSFLHGQRKDQKKYLAMAAVYAWAYLFDGAEPERFDPRLRVAADLYNRAVTESLETAKKKSLSLGSQVIELPIGQLAIEFDPNELDWNGMRLTNFIPVAELQVTGLNFRFRSPGIGAPLAASAERAKGDESKSLLSQRLKTPVTALLRIDDARKQIATGQIRATLELHTDPNVEFVDVGDEKVPLEKEPTAALAAMVAEAPVIQLEIAAFLGSITQQMDKGLLAALRPHVRGRTPVVFVHGTASSPARWAEMVNVLDNDPRINQRYEPWFFAYKSSSPIIYSSYLLRKALIDAVNRLDPDGTDTKLREMVVIGHSQGGLLTKMTAINSGTTFWDGISKRPFDKSRFDPEDQEMMESMLFVEQLPFVKRVVFLCTPHRGSFLAASDWVRSIVTRLVSLPMTVTRVTASLLTMDPELAAATNAGRVNAVDNMAPSNRFVKALSGIPVAADVPANSIIAVVGDGPLETLNDGVVEYKSAHIEGVESEKVVHSPHSAQSLPATIEEVRRILILHSEEPLGQATVTAVEIDKETATAP